jgi:hypothetical protein
MAQTSTTTRKLSQQFEIVSCVWHESGHTLFGLLKHFQITSVSLTYTEAVEGITHYFWLETPNMETDIVEHIAIDEVGMSYAGLLAETLFYKDICGSSKLPWILKEGSSPDIQAASATIKKHNLAIPGNKRTALKRSIQKDVNALLIDYWDDLKLISHNLYKVKRLSLEDLKILLTKKSSNCEFWKKQFREIETLFDPNTPLDNAQIRRILTSD